MLKVVSTRRMYSVEQRYHRLQREQKDDTSVAQLAEQRSPKPQVGGSTPSWRAESLKNKKEDWAMKDKIINFFTDVAKEMDKVTWPSREELMESTKIVILVTLIIAVFTYVVDLAVQGILKAIL